MTKIILKFVLLSVLAPFLSLAETNHIKFAWDASPDASVTGYKLHLNITNSFDVGNVLTSSIPISNFSFDTNSVNATAYDAVMLESDPSNTIYIYRPIAPDSLSFTKLGQGYSIKWRANTNLLINAYNIYLSSNKLDYVKLGYSTSTNYTIYNSNLFNSKTNFVVISAFNNTISNGPLAVLESPFSTNMNIIKQLQGPSNLRINVIIQSSTNLSYWNNITNFEYFADSSLQSESFRAKLEIENKNWLVN